MSETRRRRSRGGFVLPAVIVVLAIMTLALWSATLVLDGLTRDLRQLRNQAQLELAGATAEGRLGFLIMTEPLSQRGLRVNAPRVSRSAEFGMADVVLDERAAPRGPTIDLWFDNRPYEMALSGSDAIRIQIQDQAGLLNLNVLDLEAIARFAEANGAEAQDANKLAAALADYIDDDDFLRLNGAERDQYRRAGLPPPANTYMVSIAQLRDVFAWRETLGTARFPAMQDFLTIGLASAPFNINTAPAPVLQAWFGVSAEAAEQIIARRRQRPLGSVTDVAATVGFEYNAQLERIYTFPANRFRVWLRLARGDPDENLYETWISMAPSTADRPFFLSRIAVTKRAAEVRDGETDGGEGQSDVERFPSSPRLLDP